MFALGKVAFERSAEVNASAISVSQIEWVFSKVMAVCKYKIQHSRFLQSYDSKNNI